MYFTFDSQGAGEYDRYRNGNDIVMRHGYQAGVIEHSLSGDKEVKKAVEVLGDPAEYARITREQDTKRK